MEGLLRSEISRGFRRLLYLSTPNETSFETVGEVPDYADEAIPYFIVLLVIECIVLMVQGKELPRLNDGMSSISNGLLSLLHGLTFRSVELTVYIWVFERFNIVTLPWNSPWTWMFGFLGVDFSYYWVHRCGHEVNLFWMGHQAHHSSEDYNLTTALRQSSILRYFTWIFYLPMALFVPPSIFLVHNQFNLLYQFWIHTETISSLGPLEYIINTPSHHRVHHGRNPYCIDKNYGGTLIIWDRLFGTFVAENEKVVYGLVHPLNSWEPLYAQFCHLIHILRTAWKMDGVGNKISAFLKGPGWEPGKPRLGCKEDILEVENPVVRYDQSLPLWASLYVWAHFFALLLGYQTVAMYKNSLPALMVAGFIVFTILSLSVFGHLYDNRKFAPVVECVRCLFCVLAGYIMHQPAHLEWSLLSAVYIFFVFSTILWGSVSVREYHIRVKKIA